MKKLDHILEKPWAAYSFAACVGVVLYLILSHLPVFFGWIGSVWKLLSPVVTGIIVAYLLNPISDFFEFKVLKKLKKPGAAHFWSVVLTVVCFILFLAIILTALIPSLIQSVSKLISNWDDYTAKLTALLNKAVEFAASKNIQLDLSNITSWVEDSMSKAVELLKENVSTILKTLGDVGTSVSNFAIGVLFGVCFLVAEKSLVRVLANIRASLFKKERLERNNELWRRCHEVFIRYVGCTLMDALIISLGTLVFALIMRLPYAGLIAVVVGVTNIIPTFGPMIGSAISIFFLILDNPLNALWFFIFSCIWQAVDGMIIKPRLFKGSLGIPAVWTLVLIILGGKIAGMMGIILAIPLGAILAILYQETVEPRMKQRIRKLNNEPETEPHPPSETEEQA